MRVDNENYYHMRRVINGLNVSVEKCNACYYSIPHNEGVNSHPCKQPAQLLITVSNYHATTRPIAARPRLSIVETAQIFENHSHYEKESRFACLIPQMYVWVYWPVPSDICLRLYECLFRMCTALRGGGRGKGIKPGVGSFATSQ
jgi:hypothetical protein